jgi:hypothetical protein
MPYLKLIEASLENSIMSIVMRVHSELTGLNGSNELLLFHTHPMDSPVKEKWSLKGMRTALMTPSFNLTPKR